MLGLTVEKLMVVGIVAAIVVGPQRLPAYAKLLGEYARALRDLVESTRRQAQIDLGTSLRPQEWQRLELARYDPRAVIREALAEQPHAALPPVAYSAEVWQQAAGVRPGQRYLVSGSAAHPQRILIAGLEPDDPRRRAAEVSGDALG